MKILSSLVLFSLSFNPLLDTIAPAVDTRQSMVWVSQLYATDRWFTYPKFHETARNLERIMREIGLEQVEVLHAPADGKSQFGFWTMPLAWDAKQATLTVNGETLADYRKVPTSLCMWSGPADLTAEVVEYSPTANLRGKLVLTKQNPAGIKYELVKRGAAGAINTFTENPDLKDDRQWINSWGDNGWAYTAKSTPLPCFSITPRQAEALRRQLPVKATAKVDSRYYESTLPYVTGVIPGSSGEEEALTIGHAFEQGAMDNATGVSAMLESLATLNRLIREGKLARPKRTIRILVVSEYYATHHYIATHMDRLKRTVGAFCMDTPAAAYELPGTEFTFHLNPHSGAAYTDRLVLDLAASYFPRVNRTFHQKEFTPGTDSFLGEPTIGVPTTWVYSGTGVQTHHNSADTPEKVDERSLRDLAVMDAAFLYKLASMDKIPPRPAAPVVEHSFTDNSPIPRRLRFGTIPLDDLSPDDREGFPNGAWAQHPTLALYWADGKRTVNEIALLAVNEAGPTKFDFAGYFRFLAKRGYIELLQTQTSGQAIFSKSCAFCHGADARGGERGPDITNRNLKQRDDLVSVIRNGVPNKGMPPINLPDDQLASLIAYLKTIEPAEEAPVTANIQVNGPSFDQIIHPKAGDWPTYHGEIGGNRHSGLTQIDTRNVSKLAPAWMFSIPGAPRLQVTPVVYDGVMYVTAANEAYAVDPKTGQTLWSFRRPRTKGMAGDAASGINRGVAILDRRLFMVTDNAHLLALDRTNGKILWEVTMADYKQNYGATSAPLIAKGLVISGHSGGDEGARGFLAAYKPETGERVWRFWTVPAPGEPGSETWIGKAWEHGCGTTWLTGTYDSKLNLLIWPTGNPCPDYNGDERGGDNLYTDSDVALDPETGKLKWHFQYSPHDLYDWDATQTPMVVDDGDRHLLVHANRNGFLYVLNRENGKLIYAKPFVQKLTWAKGVDQTTGRPILNPDVAPIPGGRKACPAVEGATNWFSNAYSPKTGLFYVQALEKCTIYSKAEAIWTPGESHYGGDTKDPKGEPGKKYLRAIDLKSGKLVWEIPQDGKAESWGGILSTAGGVLFFGHDNGDFAAADSRTGKMLWKFPANQLWKASPMTYLAGGKQYVAIAAGPNVIAFALPGQGK